MLSTFYVENNLIWLLFYKKQLINNLMYNKSNPNIKQI